MTTATSTRASLRRPLRPKAKAPLAPIPHGLLQRKCACGGSPGAGGECAECQKKRLDLQRKETGGGGPATAPPIVHEVLGSPGHPLDREVRSFMEPRFGHDFSKVRVHTDSRAAEAAKTIGARAFTLGSHIAFAPGRFAPTREDGRKLLAHELAHTVLHNTAQKSDVGSWRISQPGHCEERDADRLAATGGDSLSLTLGTGSLQNLGNIGASAGGPTVFRQAETETPAPGQEAGSRGQAGDSEQQAEFGGLCIRTPLGPGHVRFGACDVSHLSDFAVIPESGTTLITPVSGGSYDADGFWYRHHYPRTEWFKVSDHCDLDVTACWSSGFLRSFCCNAAAGLIVGSPRWTSASHATSNPF